MYIPADVNSRRCKDSSCHEIVRCSLKSQLIGSMITDHASMSETLSLYVYMRLTFVTSTNEVKLFSLFVACLSQRDTQSQNVLHGSSWYFAEPWTTSCREKNNRLYRIIFWLYKNDPVCGIFFMVNFGRRVRYNSHSLYIALYILYIFIQIYSLCVSQLVIIWYVP